jgi:lipoate synthase
VVVAPEGRRLLRLEARNSQTPIENKPPWIKARLRTGPEYLALRELVGREGLHTVCGYRRSLAVLARARDAGLVTKSNLILGLGEERHEVLDALRDLHDAGCELLTITQYLRPSPRHHPVERWVTPEEFAELREEALTIGFAGVMSGPLVRSSYRAGRLYREAIARRQRVDQVLSCATARSASGVAVPNPKNSR